MRTLPVILSAALILGVTTTAATAATPKQTVKAQRVTIAKLKAQLAKVKRDDAEASDGLGVVKAINSLKDQVSKLTTANTALTTANTTLTSQASLNSGKDGTISSLQTQNAALVAQVSAQAAGGLSATLAGSPTDLWNAIAAIYGVFPNSPGCGLSKSYYASSPYFSYSFTSFGC